MDIEEIFYNKKINYRHLLDIRKNVKNESDNKKISPEKWLELIGDLKTFRKHSVGLVSANPLNFPSYEDKLNKLYEDISKDEGALTGVIGIKGIPVAIGILDSRFMMGSLGTVVGEKITRICEFADRKKLPLIIISSSGGARMQEGMFSLMQMAKTAMAINKFKENGGLYISVLTNPTTGGVSASFASLGDIIIAEPNALICFAGPRVIKQTIGENLPDGFQHAEYLLEHGMIDMIVPREKMRNVLYKLLLAHKRR